MRKYDLEMCVVSYFSKTIDFRTTNLERKVEEIKRKRGTGLMNATGQENRSADNISLGLVNITDSTSDFF